MRRTLAALALLSCAAGPAVAQDTEPAPERALDRVGRVDAVEYMRGLLENDRYDPRDRERALNGAHEFDPHWRSSIFDGRRTRATRGTGLHLPDFLPRGDEQ